MTRTITAPAHTRSHLTSAQRQELEAELRLELARLERSLERRRASGTMLLNDDHAVLASDAAEHGGAATVLAGRAARHHAAVVSALDRMQIGTYGSCVACTEPIPYGRLLAMPETAYCLSCGGRT
ncbi:MAG TPA: TraR/DksA C4-type zinc finger protein [Gemmatimonadaceae bacterium]|nr:TraR/DksA C4-type zinc finger protein [Gemmatimonadaceae bacterium]